MPLGPQGEVSRGNSNAPDLNRSRGCASGRPRPFTLNPAANNFVPGALCWAPANPLDRESSYVNNIGQPNINRNLGRVQPPACQANPCATAASARQNRRGGRRDKRDQARGSDRSARTKGGGAPRAAALPVAESLCGLAPPEKTECSAQQPNCDLAENQPVSLVLGPALSLTELPDEVSFDQPSCFSIP